jgi:hypothetical protein
MLKGCSNEGVAMLLAKSEPRVLKAGELLLTPPASDSALGQPRKSPYELPTEDEDDSESGIPSDMDVLYILRGAVRIYRTVATQMSQEKCLEEHLTFTVELSSKRLPGSDEDTIAAAARDYAETQQRPMDSSSLPSRNGPRVSLMQHSKKSTFGGGKEIICDLSGPMLLNLAPLMLREPSPLLIETLGGCDILVLTNGTFHRLAEGDLAVLRQNALNIHCPFVKPLPRTPMLRTIFQSSLSFDFLSRLQTAQVHQEPYVFSPGSRFTFGVQTDCYGGYNYNQPSHHHHHVRDDFTAALILRGEITTSKEARGTASGHPLLWPDVTLMIFGCEPCEALCLTRVEAILLRRSDIIEALLVALNETQLDTLCSALTNAFVSRVGRRPTMELGGVHPTKGTTQGRWKHLVSSSKEMSRASRPVHVVQPPTRHSPSAGHHRRDVSFHPSAADEYSEAYGGGVERQRSVRWDTQDHSVAPSSQQDEDGEDFHVALGHPRNGSGEFLTESHSYRLAKATSRVFSVQDPVLTAALASVEEYRQQSQGGIDIANVYDENEGAHDGRGGSSSGHRRSPPRHRSPPYQATRPASARPRVNHHLAPRVRLSVRGTLRAGGGYPTGLTAQKTKSDTLTMHHSAPTKGVSDTEKLHRTLEEFFS